MSSISINLETKSKVIVISSCTWWQIVGEKDKLGQLDLKLVPILDNYLKLTDGPDWLQ